MSINLTRPAPAAAVAAAHRDGHMAAFAAAEHIISTSPVIPTEVETRCRPWATYEQVVILHFFDAPDSVRQFAEHFALAVADRVAGDGVDEVEATGVIFGVQVRAWCRVSSAVAA